MWGSYSIPDIKSVHSKICDLKEKEIFFFRLADGVSGTLAAISCICFAIFAMLCIIQMTLIILKDTVGMLYKTCVAMKLALAIVGGKQLKLFHVHSIF